MRFIKYWNNIKNQDSESKVTQELLETHKRKSGKVKKGFKESGVTSEKQKQ